MEVEFNLSKQERVMLSKQAGEGVYLAKDVKEFIKRLKESLCEGDDVPCDNCYNCKKINKLAGNKLI